MEKATRHSAQREKLYDLLKSVNTHPNAEWLYLQLKQQMPGIGLATVYRNLELLKKQGKIQEVTAVDGAARFDGNPAPHHHFCCSGCGGVFDIEAEYDAHLAEALLEGTGFDAHSYQLEIRGHCPSCAQNSQAG